jgi:hypothetical protein
MAYANLPRDVRGEIIQALAPVTSGNVNATVGAASARVAIPSGCDLIRVASNTDCYINFGNSSNTATSADPIFPKGAELFKVPAGATHVAFLQVSTGGFASVSAMV